MAVRPPAPHVIQGGLAADLTLGQSQQSGVIEQCYDVGRTHDLFGCVHAHIAFLAGCLIPGEQAQVRTPGIVAGLGLKVILDIFQSVGIYRWETCQNALPS